LVEFVQVGDLEVEMRMTIELDKALLEEVQHLTQARTKSEAVRLALQEFVQIKRKAELLGLRDKFPIHDGVSELRAAEIDELDVRRVEVE
jgi:Arc/MetJ family transcription regulator